MIEKYESENSMMKYQIIFMKFQNFLYKVDKLFRRKSQARKVFFVESLKKKTVIARLKPHRSILGAKKGKFLLSKLHFVFGQQANKK